MSFGTTHPTQIPSSENALLQSLTSNAQLRNQLIGQYAPQFQGILSGLEPQYAQFANIGSPFYKEQQRQQFQNTLGQYNNAVAQGRQALAGQSYGYTPSGANAAMGGGMAQAGANSLSSNYLNQLLSNQQFMLGGLSGLQGVGQAFSPGGLFAGNPGIATTGGGGWNIGFSGTTPGGASFGGT